METTTVMLLPVCECGNIVAGLEVNRIVDVDGWKCIRPFTPYECPRCKKVIEKMIVDNKYLSAFCGEKYNG